MLVYVTVGPELQGKVSTDFPLRVAEVALASAIRHLPEAEPGVIVPECTFGTPCSTRHTDPNVEVCLELSEDHADLGTAIGRIWADIEEFAQGVCLEAYCAVVAQAEYSREYGDIQSCRQKEGGS